MFSVNFRYALSEINVYENNTSPIKAMNREINDAGKKHLCIFSIDYYQYKTSCMK